MLLFRDSSGLFTAVWCHFAKPVGAREPVARRQISLTRRSLDISCHVTQIPDVIIFINLHRTKSLASDWQSCQYLYVTYVISIHIYSKQIKIFRIRIIWYIWQQNNSNLNTFVSWTVTSCILGYNRRFGDILPTRCLSRIYWSPCFKSAVKHSVSPEEV